MYVAICPKDQGEVIYILASREPKGTIDLCRWGGDLRSIDTYICM